MVNIECAGVGSVYVERVGGVCRLPRHVPAREGVVADAFAVEALTDGRVGDVARMEVRQLRDLGVASCAAFALLGHGRGVPSGRTPTAAAAGAAGASTW
jgi:hypothetical protein